MHLTVCAHCYRAIERAPLLHVRRILRACPNCRQLVVKLQTPRARQLLAASAVAEPLIQAAEDAELGNQFRRRYR
jgi:hypothetical protein